MGPDSTRVSKRRRPSWLVSPDRIAPSVASAAHIPLRIARWIPFSRIEFRKPPASPMISPPSTWHPRHRMPSPFGQRFGAVANHSPAFQQSRHKGVLLEPLEGQMWVEHRVLIVEADDESDREATIREGVDETAAKLL